MKKYRYLSWFAVLIMFFSLGLPNITFSRPYYQGKTLTIVVPHAPGGGTDIFARLIARYLPKYIPGEPTIIIRNMPGGMTNIGGNYVYLTAKRDGLTVLAGSGASAMNSFLRTKGTRFSYDDMPLIMGTPTGDIFYTRPHLCSKPEDIVKVGQNLVFGHSPPPYSTTTAFLLGREVLGFKTKKDVLAFHSGADTRRAFLTNEIDIAGESTMGYAKGVYPLVKKGEVTPLWQTGIYDPEKGIVREGGVAADVPLTNEVYERIYGKVPSGPACDALEAYVAYIKGITKVLLFPPGTEKYATIVREAAKKMEQDLGFQKEAKKMFLGAPIYTGQSAVKIMEYAATKAEASKSWIQGWLHKGWGVEFEK